MRIVLVHGNGGGASRFAQMHPYAPDDVELLAVTLPGFSTVPRDPLLRSLPDYADRLGEMISASGTDTPAPPAGTATVLLGHGIGGSIALDLVARQPEVVDALILHAPVGASLDTRLFPKIMSTRLVRAVVKRGISSRLPRPLLKKVFFPHGAPDDVLDTFFDEYRHCAAFGDMFDLIDRPWFDSVEPVDGVPTAVLWGADDRVLRSGQADEINAKVPGAEVVVREGWDHFPMIEQPEEYTGEIVEIARRLVVGD
jgi:pimeloyl-ACP methyl ester carboxylesterase